MQFIRVGLHGLILVMADLAGIGVGAMAAFRLLGTANQVWLQLPIAVGLSVGFFCGWMLLLRVARMRNLGTLGSGESAACLFASVLWGVLIFVPLHYLTQGYVTSLGNLVALALYQLPVNALALFGWSVFAKSKVDAGEHQRESRG